MCMCLCECVWVLSVSVHSHGCVVSLIANMYSLIVFLLNNSKWVRACWNPGPLIKLHKRESLNIFTLKCWIEISFCMSLQEIKNEYPKLPLWGVLNLQFYVFYWIFTSVLLCIAGLMRAVCLIRNNWCQTNCSTPWRIILKRLGKQMVSRKTCI